MDNHFHIPFTPTKRNCVGSGGRTGVMAKNLKKGGAWGKLERGEGRLEGEGVIGNCVGSKGRSTQTSQVSI